MSNDTAGQALAIVGAVLQGRLNTAQRDYGRLADRYWQGRRDAYRDALELTKMAAGVCGQHSDTDALDKP